MKNKKELAVIVGVVTDGQSEAQLQEYFEELAFLAETAGAKTIKRFYQKLKHPHTSTFVGSGKLQEIKEYVEWKEVDMVIFDDEISPSQQRNLEKELKVKIIDRSMLILDIFASRARTAQAKTQVELAQMQYLLPRLRGMWTHLDRIKGGIGMRGAGEKEIETDKRVAQRKISLLKKELIKINKQNAVQRKSRGDLIRAALVGYTNVGKSTLMNVLSKSEVFAEDKLFATLDTTVRKVVLERTPFLLSDTVGFIRKLPHHLIESFKSTLDETRESDIIIHVVDIAHEKHEDHMKTVNATLQELGASDKPTLLVFNKMDLYNKTQLDPFLKEDEREQLLNELYQNWESRCEGNCVFISAVKKDNINLLREKLIEMVKAAYKIRYPYKSEHF